MNELIIKWENEETAIYRFTAYRFTTKGDAVTAKMMIENHFEDKIRDIKIETLEQESLPKEKMKHNYKVSFNRGTKLDEVCYCKCWLPYEAIEYCMNNFHISFLQITEVCEVFDLKIIKEMNPSKFYSNEEYEKEFS